MIKLLSICRNCRKVGYAVDVLPGSNRLELFLWLLCLLPGFFYRIGRLTFRKNGCPFCNTGEMVSVISPGGQAIVRESDAAGTPTIPENNESK